jgi:4-amino-4-deoxy-L-arabinose transferase-like glycosyltransferase
VSRTANWDAVYSLFATFALLFLALHLSNPKLRHLLPAGAFACLALLTCELGTILAPAFAFALCMDLRKRPRKSVVKDWGLFALVSFALLLLLWPAAIFKLSLFKSLLFRIRDNAGSVPNLPWTSLYRRLANQSPAFVLASVLGAGACALSLVAARKTSGETRSALRGACTMMLPFAIYVAMIFIVNAGQRLVYVHHIADMMPSLAVLFSCAAVVSARLARRPARTAVVAACLLLLAFSIPSAANRDPDIVGPQEHPGFLGVRDYLQKRPAARTYYYYGSLMKQYLPHADIEGEPSRFWTAGKIARTKRTPYDFVVSDWSMFDDAYPDIGSLSKALEPEYRLARTILHRRTRQPVAWIFSR